jgi:limonene-1,2-epoxide hydrolase
VWRKDDPGTTPLSGEYTFDHADLGVYRGIAGILTSKGKFNGPLKHIDIEGFTDIPDFEVTSSGHLVELITQFSAYVDARHGDTFLQRVDAHFSRTHVVAEGSIAGIRGRKGKTALLTLTSQQGRIEDVLGLFVKESRAPMSGKLALKAKVEIPSGNEPFLDRVKLQGGFGIDEGTFTKPDRQKEINKLSAGARGESKEEKEDPETVLSDLKGRVKLEKGTADFSDLSFGIPGALAHMHGKYSIITHKVDLHGTMQVESKISNTSTGVKALLLKVMDPIFKKKRKGEIVPVHIGGTYEHPQYGLDVGNQNAQKGKGKPGDEGQN